MRMSLRRCRSFTGSVSLSSSPVLSLLSSRESPAKPIIGSKAEGEYPPRDSKELIYTVLAISDPLAHHPPLVRSSPEDRRDAFWLVDTVESTNSSDLFKNTSVRGGSSLAFFVVEFPRVAQPVEVSHFSRAALPCFSFLSFHGQPWVFESPLDQRVSVASLLSTREI